MSVKSFLAVIAALVVCVGLFIGVHAVSVPTSSGPQTCGSAFAPQDIMSPDFGAAFGETVDPVSPKDRCDAKLAGRRTIALVTIGVGVVALLGCAVVAREPKRRAVTA